MTALEEVLERSVRKLLEEVRRRGIVKAPYGRNPHPSPLVTEEAFLSGVGGNTFDEPVFAFEYGFNPLTFLGKHVQWSHPSSVESRKGEKIVAAERLRDRALHALKLIDTSDGLQSLAKSQASGIMWGPLTGPISSTSILAIAQGLRPGKVVFQISTAEDFATTAITQTITCDSAENDTPVKVVITDLIPGTKYFIRCSLFEEESLSLYPFQGLESDDFQASSFWTLPSQEVPEQHADESKSESDRIMSQSIVLAFMPADILQSDVNIDAFQNSHEFCLTCLVGDVFSNSDGSDSNPPLTYTEQAWKLCRLSPMANSQSSLLRTSSFVLGWNDGRFGSDVDIKSEEVTYKQYMQDAKRYAKKHGDGGKSSKSKSSNTAKVPPPEPVLTRPPMSSSLSSLLQVFPIRHSESATRNIYRSFFVGASIEVFVLDLRNGFVGKEQAKWLKESLASSRAMWKLVMCGAPIAISAQPEVEPRTRPVSRERSILQVVPLVGGEDLTSLQNKVQVQLPDPGENEVDEFGRSKTSLQYLILSIQRLKSREQALNESSNDDVSSVDFSRALEKPEDLIVEQEQDTVELIESGIVFVTSNCATLGLPGRAYVATFDPAQSGKAFCVEINVGSSTPDTTKQCQASSLRVSPHMETRFLHGGDELLSSELDDVHQSTLHSCGVQCAADGTLLVELFASELPDSRRRGTKPKVVKVYEKSFRVPVM